MSTADSLARGTRRLTEISRALTYARSLEEVLDLTVDCATDLLRADQAILMLGDDAGLLHIRAARGIAPEAVTRFREPLDENLLERLTAVIGPHARDRFLGVPLVVRGAVIGLLGVSRSPDSGDIEDVEWLLSALADQAAVALVSTRRQEVHDALTDRLEILQRTDRRHEQAFEIIGHDMRTPLNAILGYAALLSGEILGPINERQREALEKLSRVGAHLESIVSNVLEMTRLNSGRIQVELTSVDVRAVAEEALDVVRPAAASANIAIELEGESEEFATTDPAHLRQILVQLLDNAVKYTPTGGHVSVRCSRSEAGGRGWVVVSVADSGPGIEPKRQKEIFEAYVRLGGESPRAQAGVGLGLAIASTMVRQLGGVLAVKSEPGNGAEFTVRLPAS